MLRKLAKPHENLFLKIILGSVAISFVALFGVTGYIDSAAQNQVVVNVDGIKTTQSSFSYQLNKEINAIKNFAGENFELTDEMRNSITENTLKQIVNEGILDKTIENLGIHFPKVLVQNVLFSQPEFIDPRTNHFNADLFNRYLSVTGMSQNEYVANIKRMIARKLLIDDLLVPLNAPKVLANAIHKMDNQRKTFKYIQVSPENIKIDREISEDEINQYFADFSEKFAIPEARDIEALFISNDYITNRYGATEEMIKDYFDQHKAELDQPEKRDVLQMVFLDEESANKALTEVNSGKDFYEVAKELKADNADNPTLGVVAYDELAEGLADEVFSLELNTFKIVEIAQSWQVISVKEITPAKEAVFDEVKPQIIAQLIEENMYDAVREVRGIIDDAVSAGKSIEEVGNIFEVQPIHINNIREDVIITSDANEIKDIVNSLDFNELVFSYGLNEFSSAEEFDNGIVVFKVTKIVDEHMPNIGDIRNEIIELWQIQEKNALAKEIAENILLEIEEGSDMATVANARNLETYRSEPISRNDSFANLYHDEIVELFLLDNNQAKLIEKNGNSFVIAQGVETIVFDENLDEEALKAVEERAKISMFNDMSNSALKAFGEKLNIVIDYAKAGFGE